MLHGPAGGESAAGMAGQHAMPAVVMLLPNGSHATRTVGNVVRRHKNRNERASCNVRHADNVYPKEMSARCKRRL